MTSFRIFFTVGDSGPVKHIITAETPDEAASALRAEVAKLYPGSRIIIDKIKRVKGD